MPYNSGMPVKHGRAEYNSYMQLVSGDYEAIPQGDNTPDGKNEYFARLVYQVNGIPVTLSGEVNAKLDDIRDAVRDSQILVKYDDPNNFTYVMTSLPGTATSGETGWKIQRVYDADSIIVMWAEGNDNYDKIASAYASYDYTFKA